MIYYGAQANYNKSVRFVVNEPHIETAYAFLRRQLQTDVKCLFFKLF